MPKSESLLTLCWTMYDKTSWCDRLDIFGGIQHHGFQQLYLFYLAKCQAGEGIICYLWIFIMVIIGAYWSGSWISWISWMVGLSVSRFSSPQSSSFADETKPADSRMGPSDVSWAGADKYLKLVAVQFKTRWLSRNVSACDFWSRICALSLVLSCFIPGTVWSTADHQAPVNDALFLMSWCSKMFLLNHGISASIGPHDSFEGLHLRESENKLGARRMTSEW